MRFAENLLPLLTASPSARVVSVLAPDRGEFGLDLNDLGLYNRYGTLRGISHACYMNSFFLEELAVRNPSISFVHAYPGKVITPEFESADFPALFKCFVRWLLLPLISPFCLSRDEVGDRMLYSSLAPQFCARSADAGNGVTERDGLLSRREAALGSDGTMGSGAYCLHWKGVPSSNQAKLRKFRDANARQIIWQHTRHVLDSQT